MVEKRRHTYIPMHMRCGNTVNFRIKLPEKHVGFWKHDFNICLLAISFILDKMLADGSDPLEHC